eukprot:4121237-Amphidinium_carterae.1
MTIEIFKQSEKKYEPANPPTKNRFFVFLLQHYRERVQNIFLRAGATIAEYNKAVEYFDDRGGTHFTRPNRRNLDEIRSTQSAEERKRQLDYIQQLPEMQRLPRGDQQPIIREEIDDYVDDDYVSETTHTRASGSRSTSLKRKSEMDDKDAKKMTTYPPGAHSDHHEQSSHYELQREKQDRITSDTNIAESRIYYSTVDTKGDVSYIDNNDKEYCIGIEYYLDYIT